MGLATQRLYWLIQTDYQLLRQYYLQTESDLFPQRHDSGMDGQPYSLILAQLETLVVAIGHEKLLGLQCSTTACLQNIAATDHSA